MKDLIRTLRVVLLHLIYNICPSMPLPKRAMIIAPHPDDEVIGCGGLIQALVERGAHPHVIILTGGEGSHRGCCDITAEDLIAGRHSLTMKAAEIMGLPMANVHCLHYPDGGVALEHSETERLAALLKELKPDAVFVPHSGEGWNDHVRVAAIVAQITGGESVSQTENEERTVKGERLTLKESVLCTPSSVLSTENSKPELYSYCVWMWYYNVWRLDFKQARLLRMSCAQHQRKLQAIDEYVTPLAPCGKPWSGVLPKPFLKATKWNKELFFKVKD